MGPGVAFVFPVVRTVEVWSVEPQDYTEVIRIPTYEGEVLDLETTLTFRIDGAHAPLLRKTVGQDYVEHLVVPYLRSYLRDMLGQRSTDLFESEDGRRKIAAGVEAALKARLGERNVVVVGLTLRLLPELPN